MRVASPFRCRAGLLQSPRLRLAQLTDALADLDESGAELLGAAEGGQLAFDLADVGGSGEDLLNGLALALEGQADLGRGRDRRRWLAQLASPQRQEEVCIGPRRRSPRRAIPIRIRERPASNSGRGADIGPSVHECIADTQIRPAWPEPK